MTALAIETNGLSKTFRSFWSGREVRAVDGISLTVVKKSWNGFSVALIPLTLKWTNLGHKNIGEQVNIEVDLMARYGVKAVQ